MINPSKIDLDSLSVTIDPNDPQGSVEALMNAMMLMEDSKPKCKPVRRRSKKKPKSKKHRELKKRQAKAKARKQRKLYLKNFRSSLKLIVDRLLGFPRLLLVDVVARIPEEHEVRAKLAEKGDVLSGLDLHRLLTATDSNVVIPRFVNALNDQFAHYQHQQRLTGIQSHPPGLFVIWAREFGKQKGYRHYHLIVGVNTQHQWKAGIYQFPCAGGSYCDRIAYAWLTAIGLNTYEDNNPASRYERTKKSYLGSFIRFPGRKDTGQSDIDELNEKEEDDPYKSRRISHTLTKKDLEWLYAKLSYMLKAETKAIPEHKKEVTKETERTFGRSELIFTGLTQTEIRRKRRVLNTAKVKREKVPVSRKNPS